MPLIYCSREEMLTASEILIMFDLSRISGRAQKKLWAKTATVCVDGDTYFSISDWDKALYRGLARPNYYDHTIELTVYYSDRWQSQASFE